MRWFKRKDPKQLLDETIKAAQISLDELRKRERLLVQNVREMEAKRLSLRAELDQAEIKLARVEAETEFTRRHTF
jgi:multidrug resistance efflux pump